MLLRGTTSHVNGEIYKAARLRRTGADGRGPGLLAPDTVRVPWMLLRTASLPLGAPQRRRPQDRAMTMNDTRSPRQFLMDRALTRVVDGLGSPRLKGGVHGPCLRPIRPRSSAV